MSKDVHVTNRVACVSRCLFLAPSTPLVYLSVPARTILRRGRPILRCRQQSRWMVTLATFSHCRTSRVHSARWSERIVTMARMSSNVPVRTTLRRGREPSTATSRVRRPRRALRPSQDDLARRTRERYPNTHSWMTTSTDLTHCRSV